jgi:hypothetical protein
MNAQNPENRQLIWQVDRIFQGWICSQCEWNSPVPTLLNDPEAKTAFDRLALTKFKGHNCADHLKRLIPIVDGFTARIRKMISRGYKPKDAVELCLQEAQLEYRGQPKVLAQAESEADDFLRRLRAGLI